MHDGVFERSAFTHLQIDEVDQQDGVAHDDAGQRDHADHAGGRVLRAQQGVAWHHANDGQRDRRHDDQRREVAAELRHHQQVDEDQAHGVGGAHVAEGLKGDLPFAIPFDGVVAQRIRGLAHKIFHQRAATRGLDLRDGAAHLEHAVQRAVHLAGHVGHHKIHRQKVFVIDGLLAHGVAYRDQLTDGHLLARGAAHGQLQQRGQIAMAFFGQLQHHGGGVFAGVVQIGGGFAGQASTQRAHNGLLGYAQQRGLAPVDQQKLARRAGNAAVIHVHQTGGLAEHCTHGLGHLAPTFGFGAIDFGHDGRQHRRPWWHFNHLHIGTHALPDLLQGRAHACGNGMALVLAV